MTLLKMIEKKLLKNMYVPEELKELFKWIELNGYIARESPKRVVDLSWLVEGEE